ncbi:MAG TPA: metal ABC transporter permease [Egibacteraceae bacterium]|nr:metal ABC transporter permease [Egibacteraceae bacterium]
MLAFDFMRKALVASVLACAVAPLVGVFVVQRQQSLVGDGIGHIAFAGVGLAFMLGVQPLAGALALVLVGAVALHRLRRSGLSGDLALAMVFYGGVAIGFALVSKSGTGVNSVLGFLFGSALNLTWGQVGAIAALSAAVVAIVWTLYGPLTAIAFDEAAARVGGVPTDGLVLTLTVVVGLVVVGGMYTLGLLLIAAMMVLPVAAAAQLARSYRGTMLLASGIGASSAAVGLLVAYYADQAVSSSILLVAIGCYALAGFVRSMRRRGRATA